MIAIIDYGLGNLGSIQNILKKIGHSSIITSNEADIISADKLILPGVGSFDTGMNHLNEKGFVDLLNVQVLEKKKPILGICLGMQLMTKSSEEGVLPGLGWINANTLKFKFDQTGRNFSIPNMGWSPVKPVGKASLYNGLSDNPRFYFVHSYFVRCNDRADVAGVSEYNYQFDASFEKENIFGVQFHPEKSHKYGMQLLRNFSSL